MVLLSHLGKGKKLPHPGSICQAEELWKEMVRGLGAWDRYRFLRHSQLLMYCHIQEHKPLRTETLSYSLLPPMPGTYQVFKEEKQQMISKVQEWPVEVNIAQVQEWPVEVDTVQVAPIFWFKFQCLLT